MGFLDLLSKANPLKWGKSTAKKDSSHVDMNEGPVSLEEGARTGRVDMTSTVTFGMDKNGQLSGVTAPNKPSPKKKL